MIRPPQPTHEPAFRPSPSGSGLLVPAAQSRIREVWIKAEARLLDRALALLQSRGVILQLRCGDRTCSAPTLERMTLEDGTVRLRCGHKDRVFSRTI